MGLTARARSLRKLGLTAFAPLPIGLTAEARSPRKLGLTARAPYFFSITTEGTLFHSAPLLPC